MPKISAQRRCSSGPSAGTNGVPATNLLEAGRLPGKLERDSPARPRKPGALLEAGRRAAVGLKLGDVDVLGDPVRIAAEGLAVADAGRLGEELAVLGNQAVAAEDQVGRRFRRPRAGVGVGRDAAARLADHQVGAILALADGLVAGRRVEQDRGPGPRLNGAGGDWHPEVLANLDAHDDGVLLDGIALEEQVDPEWHASAGQLDLLRLGPVGRSKPSALVKLLVAGKVLLGNDAQDLAVLQRRRRN